MLDLVEFLVINSDNRVEIGVQNIELMWDMFVTQANFESDQTLFLNWINKQRT